MIKEDKRSYYPRVGYKDYVIDAIELIFGLFLFGAASYVTVQANVGLSPWVAFSVGFANLTGINYGIIHVIISIVIVVLDILLKEKIGWGTLGDALIIGSIMSIFDSMHLMPLITGYWEGIAAMLAAIFITAIGSYFYMDAAFGCGPRDALFVALCRLMPKLPVGAVRILLEGSALFIGWMLGAKVGLGTVIAVFGIGIFIEIVFRVMKFDVTKVHHENLIDTHKNLVRIYRGEKTQ
jgi:uncharacterized membrane protein YczE